MDYELNQKYHPACSECEKPFTEYNSNDRVCSDECAQARKSRLQRERRDAAVPPEVAARRQRIRARR